MTNDRYSSVNMDRDSFKKAGYELINRIAELLDTIGQKPVTPGETAGELREALGTSSLPLQGHPAEEILGRATDLMMGHSLFNGHPRFMGYITASPTPIGMLADLLAASVNANTGGQILSPMATEIEKQTVCWLAELIGVSGDYGGILVSGGNVANFTAFLAARAAKAPAEMKKGGLSSLPKKLITYCPRSTHTWIEKAVVLFGHGEDSLRWIPTDGSNKMNNRLLLEAIEKDIVEGHQPFLVIGTAGDVSTGVVDDLREISKICKEHDLWFHIDGAYGAPAATLPELENMFDGLEEADSIALDPHKWLYAPLEAGCTLVKDPKHLTDAFSSKPEYYKFDQEATGLSHNYFEYGLQNSRGFKALKVWLAIQQAGKEGYVRMIRDDIELSKMLFALADEHEELEAVTNHLSITTLRYVPKNIPTDNDDYLNRLNESLVDVLQMGGKAFLSNAVIDGRYCLRSCIVNFRTTERDIEETIDIIVDEGRKLHRERMRQ